MRKTFNQTHHPELFAAAFSKGAETGLYVAEMGWVRADQTIARAATGYVNSLPLNNLRLETELRSAYICAAVRAAQSTNPENEEA